MNERRHTEWLTPTPNRAHALRRIALGGCGAWAALVVSFGGCADASLQNVRLGRVAQPMERVFVVVHKGPLDGSYASEMSNALLVSLSGHVGAQKGNVLTGMELDSTALPNAVEKFAADGLLVLKPIGGTLNHQGDAPKVTYAATLLDVHTSRVVWQATIMHEGGAMAVRRRSQIAAEKIVQSMVQAHLVRGGGP